MGHWGSGSCFSDRKGGLSLDYTTTRTSKKVNIKAPNKPKISNCEAEKGKVSFAFLTCVSGRLTERVTRCVKCWTVFIQLQTYGAQVSTWYL